MHAKVMLSRPARSASADQKQDASLMVRDLNCSTGARIVSENKVSGARRVMELSDAVVRVQHEMTNPLVALLAESQLLELDPAPNEEQRDSVKRIVDLARRVIASSRKLDALKEKEE